MPPFQSKPFLDLTLIKNSLTLGLFSDLILPPNAARIVFKMQIWSCHFLLKIFQSLSTSLKDKPLIFSWANIAFHDLAQSQFQLFNFSNPHSDFMLSRQIFKMLLSKSRFSTKLLNFLKTQQYLSKLSIYFLFWFSKPTCRNLYKNTWA